MLSWLEYIYESIALRWQQFTDWLSGVLAQILEFLDPWAAIYAAALWLESVFPAPNEQVQMAVDAFNDNLYLILDTIAWVDYFVNLSFFLFCIRVMIVTETLLLIYRGWRMARSVVT